MNRLKRFSTETQYDLAKDNFDYATVSWVEDVDEVRYMTLREKYTKEYLTFEALESGTFTLTVPSSVDSTYMTSVSYSTDNGETWTTTTVDNTTQTITTPTITQGNKVLWKGNGSKMAKDTTAYSIFNSTGRFDICGNIMSLLYGDEFADKTTFPTNGYYTMCLLFYNKKVVNARNLILPATTLKRFCYASMFAGCSSLVTAPALPATTLEDSCYDSMFQGCVSLTKAPELPATTLVYHCYISMFNGCSNLNYIKAMFTTRPSTDYTQFWVGGVSTTGTFVKNSAAQWNVTGANGVPSGWTVQTASE